ncbi:hypothetical protein DL96DRAFT_1130824 [Flagelloscypha sp. PMI_526]|nr:hypothetical protein DL96DRAFT_1130824 [Flagelloscypha sp. PMI_526]
MTCLVSALGTTASQSQLPSSLDLSLPLTPHSPRLLRLMCNYDTEGNKYGCGHYIITKKLRLNDCGNPLCKFSSRHTTPPDECASCREARCKQYPGPDSSERVLLTKTELCSPCAYWYEGEGSKRRNH